MSEEAALAWREWLGKASPEMQAQFDELSRPRMDAIRRDYPGMCVPGSPEYIRLKMECAADLDDLAHELDDHMHEPQESEDESDD